MEIGKIRNEYPLGMRLGRVLQPKIRTNLLQARFNPLGLHIQRQPVW
jgi:hypothetical protein